MQANAYLPIIDSYIEATFGVCANPGFIGHSGPAWSIIGKWQKFSASTLMTLWQFSLHISIPPPNNDVKKPTTTQVIIILKKIYNKVN